MSVVYLPPSFGAASIGSEPSGEATPRAQLEAVSEQFEALFLQQILKQMRRAGEVLAEDNGLRTRELGVMHEMHDELLAQTLAKQGQLGIAEMLVQQLASDDAALVAGASGDESEVTGNGADSRWAPQSALPPTEDPSARAEMAGEFNSAVDPAALHSQTHNAMITHPSAAFAQPIRIDSKEGA